MTFTLKRPIYPYLVGLALLWSIGEIAFRVGYQTGYGAGQQALRPAYVPPPVSQEVAPREAPPPPSLPQDDGTEIRVLVMPGGALYHNASCKRIKGGVYLPFSEARARGYTGCLECGG